MNDSNMRSKLSAAEQQMRGAKYAEALAILRPLRRAAQAANTDAADMLLDMIEGNIDICMRFLPSTRRGT